MVLAFAWWRRRGPRCGDFLGGGASRVRCRHKVHAVLSGASSHHTPETEEERAHRLLFEGARSGDLRAVAWPEVDVEGLGEGGETPLHAAAGHGHWRAVRELISRGEFSQL